MNWLLELMPHYWGYDAPNTNSLDIVDGKLLSTIIRDDIHQQSGGKTRAQLTLKDVCRYHYTSTVEFTIQPRAWQLTDQPITIFTWHDDPNGNPDPSEFKRSGPVDISIINDRLVITGYDGESDWHKVCRYEKIISMTEATQLSCQFYVDKANQGYLSLSLGGQLLYEYQGSLGFADVNPCYAKLGLYLGNWDNEPCANTYSMGYTDVRFRLEQ